jgi:predicted transcriptional regulator of viral defense system
MNKLIKFLEGHRGYARMADMKAAGIHTRDVANALAEGTIDKVKPGLYKLIEYEWDARSTLVDVCRANKAAVICLSSALEFHGLTTLNPSEITVAVPHNTDRFILRYPPIRVFYFPDTFYSPGMETIKTTAGTIKIYNREKTICDMFRYRNKLGLDLALEGLRAYLRLKEANIKVLADYAVLCHVKSVMIPYMRAIAG